MRVVCSDYCDWLWINTLIISPIGFCLFRRCNWRRFEWQTLMCDGRTKTTWTVARIARPSSRWLGGSSIVGTAARYIARSAWAKSCCQGRGRSLRKFATCVTRCWTRTWHPFSRRPFQRPREELRMIVTKGRGKKFNTNCDTCCCCSIYQHF